MTVRNTNDGFWTSAAETATSSSYSLLGGRYAFLVNATWGGGSVTLQILSSDGTTWLTAATAFTADGTVLVDLPVGCVVRVAIATATGVFYRLAKVPL